MRWLGIDPVKSAAEVEWVHARRRRANGTMTDAEIAQMPGCVDYGAWRQWPTPEGGTGTFQLALAAGWRATLMQVHDANQEGDLLRVYPLSLVREDLHTGDRFAIVGVASASAPTTAREFIVIEGPTPTRQDWDASTGDVAVIRIEPPLWGDDTDATPTVAELPAGGALIIKRL